MCGEAFELPDVDVRRVAILRAASGYLILARPEEPIHRCTSLTREDEQMLLQDAAWMFDNPEPSS